MIRVTMKGDERPIYGETDAEIVRQMRVMEWNGPSTKRDYMLEVITRVEDLTGVFVDQDRLPTHVDSDDKIDPRNFLQYLEEVGLIKIEYNVPEE